MRYSRPIMVVSIVVLILALFLTTNNLRLRENETQAVMEERNQALALLNEERETSAELRVELKDVNTKLVIAQQKMDTYESKVSAYVFERNLVKAEQLAFIDAKPSVTWKAITWYNIMTDEVEMSDLVKVEGLTIDEQVKEIAKYLSTQYFDGRTIDTTIKEEDGKLILYVDLREEIMYPTWNSQERETPWKSSYFQGSTGAMFTATSLLGSFLQLDAEGEWVDGVIFSYEGDFDAAYQHMGNFFGQVIDRK